MAEVVLGKQEVFFVVEQGVIPRGQVVHGTFTTEREAALRYHEVLRRDPGLQVTGSLTVASRFVEVVQGLSTNMDKPYAPKMRRDYEDKASEGVSQ